MYRVTRLSRSKRFRVKFIQYVCAGLIAVLLTTTTVAYLFARSDTFENIFQASSVSCTVLEYDESGTVPFESGVSTKKTNVRVKNTGDIPAYLRAAIVVTWQDADGNILGQVPVSGVDYVMEFNLDSRWSQNDTDGFFYCSSPVSAGSESDILIEHCYPVEAKVPDGYRLVVEIMAEAIQSEPADAVTKAWGMTFSEN